MNFVLSSDFKRFRKVRAVHDRTDQPGERAAAAAKMTKLADKIGLTVHAAITAVDTARDLWNPLVVEYERERSFKTATLLSHYGSQEALFEDTPMEAALRAAFDGLESLGWNGFGAIPDNVRAVIVAAWPKPKTVAAAWSEYKVTVALNEDRRVIDIDHRQEWYIDTRQTIVEEILASLPARSLNDIRSRFNWIDYWPDLEHNQITEGQCITFATLRKDVERLATLIPRNNSRSGRPHDV